MKIFGSSTLKAGIITKPFFIGVSIFLAVFCVPFFNENALANWLIFFTYVGIIIYLFFLSCIFTKSVIADLSFGNYRLTFSGKFIRYLNRFLGGIIQMMITLGIYFPRYRKEINDFWVSGTAINGIPLKFNGTAGTLCKYFFLSYVLPVSMLVILSLFSLIDFFDNDRSISLKQTVFCSLLMMLIIIFLCSCLEMKRVLNISWQKETNVPEINFRLAISPGTAIRYLIGQILLIIFTSGLLCPLVILNTYRHFISRIKLYRNSNNTPAGTSGTDLRLGQEFWFLLLKRFLCCITFGLYFPRDYTGIVKFFAGHIWIDPGSVPELKQKTPVMIENTPEHNITDRQ